MMSRITFVLCCLTYNEHLSYNYLVDFFLEPLHWIVDNFALYLGKVSCWWRQIMSLAILGPHWAKTWPQHSQLISYLFIINTFTQNQAVAEFCLS